MAILLKFAPIIGMLVWAWFSMRNSERAMLRDLDRNSRRLAEGPLLDVIQRFRGTIGIDAIQVDVYDVEPINGLAAPDGRIFLTQGLLNKYRDGHFTSDELAAVIAHEIGHLALGHHDRRKRAWKVETAARAAASAILPGVVQSVVMRGWGVVARLLHMRLSRGDEFQADAFAVQLMRRSGLDPRASITLLEKLDALAKGRGAAISWLASHPPTPKRIAAVQREIDSIG